MREDVKIKILQNLLEEITKKYDYFISIKDRIYKETYEMAVKDSLTGLYNRYYFEDLSLKLIKKAVRENRDFSVIYIDLDNFKPINDNYGHSKGDEVLKDVAKIFKENLRDYDIIVRLGGDEFIIVWENGKVESKIEEVRKHFEEVFKDYNLSFSYGIASIKDIDIDGLAEDQILSLLLEIADKRMYEQKMKRKQFKQNLK